MQSDVSMGASFASSGGWYCTPSHTVSPCVNFLSVVSKARNNSNDIPVALILEIGNNRPNMDLTGLHTHWLI